MGIYDERKGLRFPDIGSGNGSLLKYAGTALAIILALAVLFFAVQEMLKPQPFTLIFSKNPLDLSKEYSTVLKVRLKNITGEKAENVLVKVVPEDDVSMLVFPKEKTVEVLGTGETRELLFTIRPDPRAEILPGAYKIKVKTELNGKVFEEDKLPFHHR